MGSAIDLPPSYNGEELALWLTHNNCNIECAKMLKLKKCGLFRVQFPPNLLESLEGLRDLEKG